MESSNIIYVLYCICGEKMHMPFAFVNSDNRYSGITNKFV